MSTESRLPDVVRSAWEASQWQFPAGYTFDDFAADSAEWEFWPVVVFGQDAGAIMVRGCEMHCCIKPKYFRRWATPAMFRRVMAHKKKHGRLTTSVNVDHDAGREFVERMGFTVIGNAGNVLLYELR